MKAAALTFRTLAACVEIGPEAGPGVRVGLESGWRQEEVPPSLQGRRGSQKRARGLPPTVLTRAWRPSPSERCTSEAPGPVEPGFGRRQREERSRQVAGPGSDARVPGKFTEQDSRDDLRTPRGA